MKKILSLVLAVALCLSLLTTSAFAVDEHEKDYLDKQVQLVVDNLQKFYEDKYGEGALVAPYDEPVEVTIVNYYDSTLESNMAIWNEWWGETLENNRYVQAAEKALNIKIKYQWLKNNADNGYVNQLRLSIAAGDIPDMFIVTNQNDLVQLAESDLIMPIDDVVDKYFTTWDKEIQNSDGGMLYEMASYDGQRYGIPCNISDTDTFSYIWLRKDWMEALNLEAPKTMDDLKNIMVKFAEANLGNNENNYGMLIDKSLYYSTRGLFAGFKAYPEFWVEEDGKLVWGGTQENVKKALTFLNGLYNDGMLDKEFITQSNTDAQALILNSQTGIVYAGHWLAGTLMKLHDVDENSDWMCVTLPSEDGSPVEQYLTPNKRGWIVINKNYEHPEVAAKIRALCTFVAQGGICDGTWWFSNDSAQNLEPFQASVSSWDNYNTYLNLLECYDAGGDTSVLRAKAVTYWNNLTTGNSIWNWEHMFGNGPYTPMVVLRDAIENDRIRYDGFLGAQNEFMQDRWTTIMDEQLTAFTKIIIGEVGVDEGFDNWLKTFDSMGGTQITNDVNEWYAQSQTAKNN